MTLRVRWLGRVPYRQALAVQEALVRGDAQHLLLLEHPHVFTYGPRTDLGHHLRVDPSEVDAELIAARRGGDITYHGPGQLVGYPIVSLVHSLGALDHVAAIEQVIIAALAELGVDDPGILPGHPGVWVGVSGPEPRKICAIGVRLTRGRTMHGFALNVAPEMRYLRECIVPCGLQRPVTSLAEEGIGVPMRDVVDVIARIAAAKWGAGDVERQDVAWRERADDLAAFSRGLGPGEPVRGAGDHLSVRLNGRLAAAGVNGGLEVRSRKPEWLRPRVHLDRGVLDVRRTVRDLGLVTVCEEAGCPNLSECWADGTATLMVLGERCTRACGFCLIDTQRPLPADGDEPERVAEAVERMGLTHTVLTMVARDDLADGGMGHVAACVEAIRRRCPATRVETLISDAKGDRDALGLLFAVRPDVLNHNVETVARLQRAVRPSAGYARSLAVLSMAAAEGLTTKSGLIVGMGETAEEVDGCLADLAAIGVDIVTVGQYLRPTSHHLPVVRWVEPAEFDRWASVGEALGIGHVEASPLTRSSYHARQAAEHTVPVALR
jgi:lipoyl synthase